MIGISTSLLLTLALIASPALADQDCAVPMTDWQPREAVVKLAAEQGWALRRIRIDDHGDEGEGGWFWSLSDDDDEGDDGDCEDEDDCATRASGNAAKAGTVAPPQNGLFTNGTAPAVK